MQSAFTSQSLSVRSEHSFNSKYKEIHHKNMLVGSCPDSMRRLLHYNNNYYHNESSVEHIPRAHIAQSIDLLLLYYIQQKIFSESVVLCYNTPDWSER